MTALFPNLERFLIENAPPHIAVDDAPENLEQLNAWANTPSIDDTYPCTVGPVWSIAWPVLVERYLPVWNGASDSTIYSSPDVNFAYRAYHDWTHLRLQADVDLESEKRVSSAQLEHARAWGLEGRDLAALWADSHGQNEYFEKYGEFMHDQRAFVLAYVDQGRSFALSRKW